MQTLIKELKALLGDTAKKADWNTLLPPSYNEYDSAHKNKIISQYLKNGEECREDVKWAFMLAVEKGISLYAALKLSVWRTTDHQSWLKRAKFSKIDNSLSLSVINAFGLMKYIVAQNEHEDQNTKDLLVNLWIDCLNTCHDLEAHFVVYAVFGLEARSFFMWSLSDFMMIKNKAEWKSSAVNRSVKQGLFAIKDVLEYVYGKESFNFPRYKIDDDEDYPENWKSSDMLFERLEKVYAGKLTLADIQAEHQAIRSRYFAQSPISNYCLEAVLSVFDGKKADFEPIQKVYQNLGEKDFLEALRQIDPFVTSNNRFWESAADIKSFADLKKHAGDDIHWLQFAERDWESLLS